MDRVGRSKRKFMMKKKPAVQTSLKFKKVGKPCSKPKQSAASSIDQVATSVPAHGQIISSSAIMDAISELSDSSDENSFHLSVQEAFAALPPCVRDRVLGEANSNPDFGGPDQAFMRLFAESSPSSLMQWLQNTGVEDTDMENAVILIKDIVSALRS